MNCVMCGKRMKRVLIPNPFGLARVDMYVCNRCKDGMYFGSQDLWEKFQTTITALSAALDGLKTIQKTTGSLGGIVDDTLETVREVVLNNKEAKR